mmetsp:Transcript_2868/g.5911  ORF Transcript_2868/g.5911 Transcript_2868/m.5911 type:complete len:237 (-) Transcript_2868:571-1281(-)
MVLCGAPFSSASFRAMFTSIISCSLMVRSSSFDPPPTSMATEGRIGTGGTRRLDRRRFSGRPIRGLSQRSSQSRSGIFLNSSRTLVGRRSSLTNCLNLFSSLISALSSLLTSPCILMLSLTISLLPSKAFEPVYGSWTIFKVLKPVTFFTTPLQEPQWGQRWTFLHDSITFFRVACFLRMSVLSSSICPVTLLTLLPLNMLRYFVYSILLLLGSSLSRTLLQVLQMHWRTEIVCLK